MLFENAQSFGCKGIYLCHPQMPFVCLVQIILITFSYLFPILVTSQIPHHETLYPNSHKNQSEARTYRRQRNHLQPCKHRHQPRDRGAAGARAGISPSRAMGSISIKAMSKGSPRGISSYHTCTSRGCWGLWSFSASLIEELEPCGNLRWLVRKS